MSDTQHDTPVCHRHHELAVDIADMKRDNKEIRKIAGEMQTEQKLFIGQISDSFDDLAKKMHDFTNDIDDEIRGGRGPESGPGLKQLVHDNKSKIAELKQSVFPWRQIGVAGIIAIVTGVVGAIITYVATR